MGAGERKNKSYAIDRYPDLKEQKLKELQALNEMLGVNLSTTPTPDLVRELCSRDELITATSVYSDEEFVWSKWGNLKNGNWDLFDSGRIRNTNARIIVVRGDE